MSLYAHAAVFCLVVLDLIVGGWALGRIGGRFATTGFEFVVILGYILFVLQWGVPWGNQERDDSQQ